MFTPGRSWAMTFTSRVASVIVRPSILIDLVFSKTLIRKARLIPGLFFYIFTPKLARAGSQVTKLRTRSQMPGASGSRVQGPSPALKPGVNAGHKKTRTKPGFLLWCFNPLNSNQSNNKYYYLPYLPIRFEPH